MSSSGDSAREAGQPKRHRSVHGVHGADPNAVDAARQPREHRRGRDGQHDAGGRGQASPGQHARRALRLSATVLRGRARKPTPNAFTNVATASPAVSATTATASGIATAVAVASPAARG